MNRWKSLMHIAKRPVIFGMVHARALPGSPKSCLSVKEIVSKAVSEALLYKHSAVDAIIVENMHDVPYVQSRNLGPEVTAMMTCICNEIRKVCLDMPLGVQILAGGNEQSLAVALATDFDFIRAECYVFSHVADEGIMDACAGQLLRYRKAIGAEHISVVADIKKKHSAHSLTSDVSIEETAKAAEFFLADGLIVTGSSTGSAASADEVQAVKASVSIPVLVGSGVTTDNMTDYKSADGFIVGSYFKKAGQWQNEIDEYRVSSLTINVSEVQVGVQQVTKLLPDTAVLESSVTQPWKCSNHGSQLSRKKRWSQLGNALWGTNGHKMPITISFKNYWKNGKGSISIQEQEGLLRECTNMWAEVSSLEIKVLPYGKVGDLNINFVKKDGPFGLVGFAYSPVPSTHAAGMKVELDRDEQWYTRKSSGKHGVEMLYVMCHEIGHSLGLADSNVELAIMHGIAGKQPGDAKLHRDDIEGIQSLYGPPTSTADTLENMSQEYEKSREKKTRRSDQHRKRDSNTRRHRQRYESKNDRAQIVRSENSGDRGDIAATSSNRERRREQEDRKAKEQQKEAKLALQRHLENEEHRRRYQQREEERKRIRNQRNQRRQVRQRSRRKDTRNKFPKRKSSMHSHLPSAMVRLIEQSRGSVRNYIKNIS